MWKENSEAIVDILKILSNNTRLSILGLLILKNCNVGEFTEIFNLTQPAITRHLRILKNADLIHDVRKGPWTVYSINRENIYFPLVQDILNHFPNQQDKLDWLEQQGLRIIY